MGQFRSVSIFRKMFCAGCLFTFVVSGRATAQSFVLERVAGGLDHPVYATQAPGDPNHIYILERYEGTGSSRDPQNLARVKKVDLNTHAVTTWLELTGIITIGDGGMHCMEFHPNFQTNGKVYLVGEIADPTDGSGAANFLDEYIVTNDVPVFNRRVLLLPERQNSNGWHSTGWIGFKYGATGAERSYMYISQGDGGIQANQSGFVNVAQDLGSMYGKILRIDVDGADYYPGDPLRNYAIPPDNPYFEDANHDGFDDDPATAPEVLLSGLRNPWRMSIDRATGDIYLGDVGFNSVEEFDFARADWDTRDYGWAKREGTIETPVSGVGGLQGDSLNPIQEFFAGTADAAIGGVVYRGPVAELQGLYFFADHIHDHLWTGRFDRDTDPNTFNGGNMTEVQDRWDEFESLIVGGGTLDNIVSFGEDLEGNLYIMDFGTGGSSVPTYDTGEVYRIIPVEGFLVTDPESLTVDKGDTAVIAITAANATSFSWKKNGVPLVNGGNISGVDTTTLTITNVQLADEGDYSCEVSDGVDTVETAAAQLLTCRLMGHWKLDGDLTDSVQDTEPGAPTHDGVGNASFVTGIDGQAYQFALDTNVVEILDSSDYFNFYPRGFTVSAWVRDGSQNGSGGMISKQTACCGAGDGFTLDINSAEEAEMTIRGVSSRDTNIAVTDGDWHLIAAVYNRNAGTLTMYMDGIPLQQNAGLSAVAAQTPGAALVFGAEDVAGAVPYDGQLDDIRIYSCPLTPTEVASLYTDVVGGSVKLTNLVGWYRFDDGTGKDNSGWNNHGLLNNGASVVDDPDRGNVLELDGSDDYVDLGTGSSLNLSISGQATIAAWVKFDVTKSHNSIVTKGEWKDAYSLLIKGDNANRLWTGNDTAVYSADSIPLGQWTYVAVTIDGDLATFYINGAVNGTANQDRGNPIDNTATPVSIGREQYSGNLPAGRWFFDGRMDDVRIYEVALSADEIAAIMNASPADINGDGRVDFIDFCYLNKDWETNGSALPTSDIAPPGGDGIVDIQDLTLFAQEFFK